jgi:hypothetical protein
MLAIPSRKAALQADRISKLSLYREAPTIEVNLDELERSGLSRLHGI